MLLLVSVSAATLFVSLATLGLNLWIGYSLDRHRHYDPPHVTLRQRMRHPTDSPEAIKDRSERRDEAVG